jgi:hypothetical protein
MVETVNEDDDNDAALENIAANHNEAPTNAMLEPSPPEPT